MCSTSRSAVIQRRRSGRRSDGQELRSGRTMLLGGRRRRGQSRDPWSSRSDFVSLSLLLRWRRTPDLAQTDPSSFVAARFQELPPPSSKKVSKQKQPVSGPYFPTDHPPYRSLDSRPSALAGYESENGKGPTRLRERREQERGSSMITEDRVAMDVTTSMASRVVSATGGARKERKRKEATKRERREGRSAEWRPLESKTTGSRGRLVR